MTQRMRPTPARPAFRLMAGTLLIGTLSACETPLDFDLRGKLGSSFDTSDAALKATARRPKPDDRGIISYPNYQVAVAQRGDTLRSLAERIGSDANALAKYNGIKPDDPLRKGEIVALPRRVAEPLAGPIKPAPADITQIASAAIDRAAAPDVQTTSLEPATTVASPQAKPAVQTGAEPIRHKVSRGETAFTISRLYNVSVRSLAEWNGLGSDFAIREGQFLLIPVANQQAPTQTVAAAPAVTTKPGVGSPTPTPPSSTKPLPAEKPKAAAAPVQKPISPDLGATQTKASTSTGRMILPVDGSIIREYKRGKTDGIDISGQPGQTIKAAASGRVGAITADPNGQNIVVIKHADGLLTVYANVSGITVKKGDSVSRGQKIAEISPGSPAYVRFGVYKGSDSTDPAPYLQ